MPWKSSERYFPFRLPGGDIDGCECAEGWCVARQLFRAKKKDPRQPEWRAALPGVFDSRLFSLLFIEFVARNEADVSRQAIGGHDQQAAAGVESRAAPGHAADIARENERTLNARRSEDALGALAF